MQQVDQIFRPFFQAGTRPSGGYGVGLTIVKRIADRFDWLLSVNSKPNHGTKITIKIFIFKYLKKTNNNHFLTCFFI